MHPHYIPIYLVLDVFFSLLPGLLLLFFLLPLTIYHKVRFFIMSCPRGRDARHVSLLILVLRLFILGAGRRDEGLRTLQAWRHARIT